VGAWVTAVAYVSMTILYEISRRRPLKPLLYVLMQFFLVGWIFLMGPLIPDGRFPFSIFLSGVVLGGWAIITMTFGNLNVLPTVREDAVLVLNGPYRVIRHPMYTSLLLITAGEVLNDLTAMRSLVWLLLVATLVAKLVFEEKLLAERFAEYSRYQQRSWRLLPFLY
jgi:protein-S-isoprenylcysteine O-methyltransferase Ste14